MKPAALPDRARNTSKLNNPVNRDDSDAIWGNFSTKPLALSAEFVAQRSQAILPSPSAAKVCGWISAVVNEFIRYAYAGRGMVLIGGRVGLGPSCATLGNRDFWTGVEPRRRVQ